MAFENLFIRTEKSIGGIKLDAVLSESHTNELSVTTNPVELGADTTDHSVIEPKKITITAQVSDTPAGFAAIGQIIDNVTGLFGSSNEQNLTRSIAAYNAIVQLQETREPIEVQTKLKLYTNMIITSIRVDQNKDTSRVARMVISLQEILVTESEIIQLSEEQLGTGSARDQATSPENTGRKEAVEPSGSTNTSVLKSVIDWVSG